MSDVSALFDPSVDPLKFDSRNLSHIPDYGSIIYSVFLDASEFIYVGIGGLAGKTVLERNPRSRILQHAQGRRSGDQFCIYIQDHYVIPQLIGSPYTPRRGYLDQLVKEFIRTRLSYRYLVFQTDDSDREVRRLERLIQAGEAGFPKPTLNGTGA